MKTFVYVDAFNLYYGTAKDTPYKWLDLQALCQIMIPKNTLHASSTSQRLLVDAFDNAFECAVIVSGDSDLRAPVQIVANRFHKTLGVLNPQKKPCKALQGAAHFYKHIREAALQASQFPAILTDRQGTFHKPSSW